MADRERYYRPGWPWLWLTRDEQDRPDIAAIQTDEGSRVILVTQLPEMQPAGETDRYDVTGVGERFYVDPYQSEIVQLEDGSLEIRMRAFKE